MKIKKRAEDFIDYLGRYIPDRAKNFATEELVECIKEAVEEKREECAKIAYECEITDELCAEYGHDMEPEDIMAAEIGNRIKSREA